MSTLISFQLVTRAQLEAIYTAWGVAATVPHLSTKELVCWPIKEHAEITKTRLKSDTGRVLFKIEFYRD